MAGMTDATPAWMLFTATFGYWLLTVPILVLGNAICYAHLKEPTREFGGVRLWGTIGWMVQGWIVLAARFCVPGLSPAECTSTLFRLGSVLAFVLAGYWGDAADDAPTTRCPRSGGPFGGARHVKKQTLVRLLRVSVWRVRHSAIHDTGSAVAVEELGRQ